MSSSSASNGAAAVCPANGETVPEVGDVPVPRVEGTWTVDKALDTFAARKPAEGTASPVPYFHILERLKTTKREGWKRFGINRGESIADHMYRMSLMTMLCPPALAKNLDLSRCMKMCLIHDMAESLVGDITPVEGVAKPEKSRREAETMDYITGRLLGGVNGGDVGAQIREIWQEYEDSETLESVFVHDIDKMELLLQMVEYEKRGEGKLDLGEFAYVKLKIALPEVREWAEELVQQREEFWGGRQHTRGDVGTAGGVAAEFKKKQESFYEGHGEGQKK
ncbi:HD domain-containing protein [Podospora conica]|nr:HD domain-containing protein [Schizothecium conicum]